MCRLIGWLALLAAIFLGWLALGSAFSIQERGISDLLVFTGLFFLFLVSGLLLLLLGTPGVTMRDLRALPAALAEGMTAHWQVNLCVASYWLLFILAPTGIVSYLVWPDHAAAFISGFLVLILLILLGERGFRYWKHLWKVDVPNSNV